MEILQRLLRFFKQYRYPKNLQIRGRQKLPSSSFKSEDLLFHSFDKDDLDEEGHIKVETIKFPDFSCNWSLFSVAKDIKYRKNSHKTDGCYSFTVQASRYKNMATPVHDPISDPDYPNYAHVEVRALRAGEDDLFEPPKKRKLTESKSKKLEYRKNIQNRLQIEFDPE